MNYTKTFSWALFLSIVLILSCKFPQKTTALIHTECDSLFFDLDTGMVNAVSPMLSQMDIKEWFTCYTGSTPDGSSRDCGGAVFYKNHGFTYYTFQNYVEVSKGFKGKLSKPLLGMTRKAIRTIYPEIDMNVLQAQDYPQYDFFKAPYGCLSIAYEKDTAVIIATHFTPCENLDICTK